MSGEWKKCFAFVPKIIGKKLVWMSYYKWKEVCRDSFEGSRSSIVLKYGIISAEDPLDMKKEFCFTEFLRINATLILLIISGAIIYKYGFTSFINCIGVLVSGVFVLASIIAFMVWITMMLDR